MNQMYFRIKSFIIAGTCVAVSLLFINWNKSATDSVTVVKRITAKSINKFYTSNKTPLQPNQFIKLPAGSIKPQGWILRYLELHRDGLTGHLGEISAWLDKNDNAWFSGTGKGDQGW